MFSRKRYDRRRLLGHTSEQKRFLRSWQGTALTSEIPYLEFGPHLGSGSFVSPSLEPSLCSAVTPQTIGTLLSLKIAAKDGGAQRAAAAEWRRATLAESLSHHP